MIKMTLVEFILVALGVASVGGGMVLLVLPANYALAITILWFIGAVSFVGAIMRVHSREGWE